MHECLLLLYVTDLLVLDYATDVDGLLKVNRDSIGFYRVNYNDLLWSSVSQQLLQDHKVFPVFTRVLTFGSQFLDFYLNILLTEYQHK